MAIKEKEVITPGNVQEKLGNKISVRFCYGLKDKRDFEMLTRKNSHYIFVAFAIKDAQSLHIFGDARRHEELEQAITDDIGKLDQCIYGQLWFLNLKVKNLTFNNPLGKNDKEIEENLLDFLNSINDDLLRERTDINDNEDSYEYRKNTKILRRI